VPYRELITQRHGVVSSTARSTHGVVLGALNDGTLNTVRRIISFVKTPYGMLRPQSLEHTELAREIRNTRRIMRIAEA
jgi:hypothetical protein